MHTVFNGCSKALCVRSSGHVVSQMDDQLDLANSPLHKLEKTCRGNVSMFGTEQGDAVV